MVKKLPDDPNARTLGHPQVIVTHYFNAVRRMCKRLDAMDGETLQEEIAMCVVLTVAAVEVFFNVFFRFAVELLRFSQHREAIQGDIAARKPLEKKLKDWPPKVLDQALDFGQGVAQEFDELRRLRNGLMHYAPNPEKLDLGRVSFEGLANIDIFASLKSSQAKSALSCAEKLIQEVLSMCPDTAKELQANLWHWTGRSSAGTVMDSP